MSACTGTPMEEAWLLDDFCVDQFPLTGARFRSIITLGTSSLLAVERNTESVLLLEDTNGDGIPDNRTVVATADSLNHGLVLHQGYLYASSDTQVYRWKINDAFETRGEAEVVIENMSPGSHSTRTLVFDDQGRLYVSIGSENSIDADSFRSRIRRFDMSVDMFTDPDFPIDFETGEIFADGLRNEVGLAFDKHGVLWGVGNGPDNLERPDLGVDLTEDNPGEEMHRFREEDAGKHWGYPWCWSEYNLSEAVSMGVGTQWAWPTTMEDVTDEDCRTNFMPADLVMQAHSAPLDLVFYDWKADRPDGCVGGFPQSMDGFAFLSFHGSWNRVVPTGYKVVYVEMDADGNIVGDGPRDLLMHQAPDAKWPSRFRPVGVDFDECGRLVVSSDGTFNEEGSIMVRISHNGDPSTAAPLSAAPVTTTPLTSVPVTSSPVSAAPVTATPLTSVPVTAAPLSAAPVTAISLTLVPVTAAPLSAAPVTETPLTLVPVTEEPLSAAPVTAAPMTLVPVTAAPMSTSLPSLANVTLAPLSAIPTISSPPSAGTSISLAPVFYVFMLLWLRLA